MKLFLKYLVLFFWILVVTGVSTEFVARKRFEKVTLTVHCLSEFEWDKVIGWRGKRGFDNWVFHGKIPVHVQINHDGFRDDDWDVKLAWAAQTHSKKLLVVGDSTVYGHGERREDRLSDQMEKEFLSHGEKVAVFNASIPGFSPSQEYRLLPELLGRIAPDEILVVLCGNDYGDISLPYDHRYPFRVYKPFYDENGNLVLNASVPRRPSLIARGTIFRNLYSPYFIDEVYYRLQDHEYRKHGILSARDTDISRLDRFVDDEKLLVQFPYVEKTFISLLTKMNELAESKGSKLYILSTKDLIETRLFPKLPPEIHSIPSLNLPSIAPEKLYIPLDGHPNRLWSQLYSKMLYPILSENHKEVGEIYGRN